MNHICTHLQSEHKQPPKIKGLGKCLKVNATLYLTTKVRNNPILGVLITLKYK